MDAHFKNINLEKLNLIFVEPEGLETDEIYLNGLSSSLPEEVQDAFLRTMPGFETNTLYLQFVGEDGEVPGFYTKIYYYDGYIREVLCA